MYKKISRLSAFLVLLILVAGCSSLNLPGSKASTTTTQQSPLNQDLTNQPLSSKLAIGTLALEDTPNAVTAEQAVQLIPLWKAVRSLGNSNNTSQEEIAAVYKQIEDAMTPGQIQAIEKMSMTPEESRALMEKMGIQAPQFGTGGNLPNLTESERATQIAQFQAQGGATGDRGGFEGGGMPLPPAGDLGPGGGGFPGGDIPGGQANQSGNGTTRALRTPSGTMQARRTGGGGSFFIEPLIRILQERAGIATSTPSAPFGRPGGSGTPGPNATPVP